MKKPTLIFLYTVLALILIYFFFYYLPNAFKGTFTPDPYAFTIGLFKVRWYGLLIASAVGITYFLSEKDLLKSGLKQSTSENILLTLIICGTIGARIGFIIQSLGYYSKNLIQIFKIWDGGLSIHGAILGGILSLIIISRHYKVSFLKVSNAITPHLFLATAIGRFGNFFNQEIVGQPTNIAWKMFVAPQNRLPGFENFSFFHPVFLYESIAFLVFYLAYLFLRKKWGTRFGFSYTLVFYSLTRIFVEFWRIDYKPIFLVFDLAQLVSFGIMILGLIIGIVTLTHSTKTRLRVNR